MLSNITGSCLVNQVNPIYIGKGMLVKGKSKEIVLFPLRMSVHMPRKLSSLKGTYFLKRVFCVKCMSNSSNMPMQSSTYRSIELVSVISSSC